MSVLEVQNVSIRYITGDFKDIGLKEYTLKKLKGEYHVTEFWADRNISFRLEKGDMLGVIGANGAGKSTLLKAISGIMEPTRGYVKRQGGIAALLELASGFDGDLTVRENTYLRGAMLGYTRKFMDETYGQIIEFAELQDFQDRPFRQLSSGMKSRLAFSIASLVQPDILILDEVLSVGDGAFRKKSEGKMREIIAGGAATILVSHSIRQVREMCNKVLWLHQGKQVMLSDDVQAVCDAYETFLTTKELAEGFRDEEPVREELAGVDHYGKQEGNAFLPHEEARRDEPSEQTAEPMGTHFMKAVFAMLLCLILNGKAIQYCVENHYYASGFVFIFTLAALFCIFAFLLFSRTKKRNILRNAGIILLMIAVAGIIFNMKVLGNKTSISSRRLHPPTGQVSVLSIFMWEYDGTTALGSYRLFAETVYPEIFQDKHLIVSSAAVKNVGISNVLQETDHAMEEIASIEEERLREYLATYEMQEVRFANGEESRSIYFLTDEAWLTDGTIYLFNCGGSTLAVPESLAAGLITAGTAGEPEQEAFNFEKIYLNFHTDSVISRLSMTDRTSYFTVRIKHFMFLMYLFILGLIGTHACSKKLGSALACLLAFPIGCAIYIFGVVFAGLLRVPMISAVVFGVPLILALCSMRYCMKKTGPQGPSLDSGGLAACVLVIFVLLYCCFYSRVTMTNDSYSNISLAKDIVQTGSFIPRLSDLTSYSFAGPIINVGVNLLGVSYSFAFQPAFTAIGLFALLLIQNRLQKGSGCKQYLSWMISLAVMLFYATTPFFRVNAIWLLNNMTLGIWLGISIGMFLLYHRTGEWESLYCAVIPLVLFSFTRIESQLFTVAILVCLRRLVTNKEVYKKLVYLTAGMSAALYLLLLSAMWRDYDPVFWSPLKGAALVCLLFGLAVFTYLEGRLRQNRIMDWMARKLEVLMLAALLLVLAVMSVIKTELSVGNLISIFQYLLPRGYWGIWWLAVMVLIAVSALFKSHRYFAFFESLIWSFALVLFDLMLFRTLPLHNLYTDSSCRMLLHLTPSIGIFMSLVICEYLGQGCRKMSLQSS